MATKPTPADLRYALKLTMDAVAALQLAQVVMTGENIESALRRLHGHAEGLRYQIEVAELKAGKGKYPPTTLPDETAP